jgi:hypothetical protein
MWLAGRVAPGFSWAVASVLFATAFTSACLAGEGPSSVTVPDVNQIVRKMIAANARRAQELRAFTGKRSYRVEYHGFPGSRDAEMEVEVTYVAPDKKDFKIISQAGSKLLVNHVFLKLIDSEKEYLEESTRRASELSPANYQFSLLGEEGQNYVLAVNPREKSKFLYKGTIWVDMHDFAVARIEGEPAKNPSFWISKTEIKHQYTKIGDFWLPARNESVTQVRLGGKADLTINYTDYHITGTRPPGVTQPNEPTSVLPSPDSVTADPH